MKILVAVKQVPERDASLHVAADGKWIDDADVGWTINEPDAYALEEALRLKETAGGGEVIVLCAGPERVLRRCGRRWRRGPTGRCISRRTTCRGGTRCSWRRCWRRR